MKNYIISNKNKEFLLISDYTVNRYEKEHNCKVNLFDYVFATQSGIPGILQTGNADYYVSWPTENSGLPFFK